ncbi:MAG: nuclear transport factor 2 family protein [Bacteroidota bacterium]
MNTSIPSILVVLLLITLSCKKVPAEATIETENNELTYEQEKRSILATLNNETKAAFQRDYDAWQNYWVHDEDIAKVYLDFPENTFSESLGWAEIDQFVKTFFENHPKPEPIPKLLDSINVRLFGKGAWVTYEQQDSIRGLKRETRLMEKVDGRWKIAGMQTTIYGFDE